jgi:hypothetical protein
MYLNRVKNGAETLEEDVNELRFRYSTVEEGEFVFARDDIRYLCL